MKKNELAGRIPPQDGDLEQLVLGALLIDKEAYYTISGSLIPDVFYFENNRIVYQAIAKLNAEYKQVDIATVAQQLKKDGKFEEIGGAKALAILSSKLSSAAHVETHVKILNEKWIKRNMILAGTLLVSESYDEQTDPFETLTNAEKIIAKTNDHITGSDETTLEMSVDAAIKGVFNQEETESLEFLTKLNEIDERIGGIVAPDLTLVAARPSMGKSSFAYTTIKNLCEQGISVGVVTLEVQRKQVVIKLLSMLSGVPGYKLLKKKYREQLTDQEKQRIYQASLVLKKWKLYIDETSDSIGKFRLKAANWKRKYGVKVILLDYIQLMSGSGKSGTRDNELGEVSRGLKKTCREMDMGIVALAQLSRDVDKRPDKMPVLSDLRESGNLEQDADNVLFLMRPEYYGFKEIESPERNGDIWQTDGLCVVNLAKNRHGETGKFPLHFIGTTGQFENSRYSKEPEPTSTQFPITNRLTAIAHEF